uniref:Ig-like domain-containing protein n=1 Tax=Anopheles minimus TaxID=112268 RepID=A0A182WLW6_9DIPT
MEPPSRLEFSNSSGGWLDCSASGSPQPSIDWLSVDGTSVGDVGGVRRVLRNGTLVLLPFPAAAYRQDIHSTIYRCVASNTVGRVISRDVQVRAGSSTTPLIRLTVPPGPVQFPLSDYHNHVHAKQSARGPKGITNRINEHKDKLTPNNRTEVDNGTESMAGTSGQDGQLFRFRSNTLSITL